MLFSTSGEMSVLETLFVPSKTIIVTTLSSLRKFVILMGKAAEAPPKEATVVCTPVHTSAKYLTKLSPVIRYLQPGGIIC